MDEHNALVWLPNETVVWAKKETYPGCEFWTAKTMVLALPALYVYHFAGGCEFWLINHNILEALPISITFLFLQSFSSIPLVYAIILKFKSDIILHGPISSHLNPAWHKLSP
jgi:hypothetical protein